MLALFEAPTDDPGIRAAVLAGEPRRDERRRTEARRERRLPERRYAAHHPRLREDHRREAPGVRAGAAPARPRCRGHKRARRISRPRRDAGAAGRRRRRGAEARDDAFNAEFGADAQRFLAVGDDHTFDNPKFLEFVLFGADGKVRPELAGAFPDDRHALMVVRMNGNLSFDDSSRVAANVVKAVRARALRRRDSARNGPAAAGERDQRQDEERAPHHGCLRRRDHGARALCRSSARAGGSSRCRPSLIGCVSAFGLMGFAGIPLTIVTISGLPILIGPRRRLRDPDAQPDRR